MVLAICISILGLILAPTLAGILIWAIFGVLATVANGALEDDRAGFIAAAIIGFGGLVDLAALVTLIWWIVHLWTVALS